MTKPLHSRHQLLVRTDSQSTRDVSEACGLNSATLKTNDPYEFYREKYHKAMEELWSKDEEIQKMKVHNMVQKKNISKL